ncbi:MAG: hypothetical protein JWM98_485, partial [Thermoleophilia bacterium]|nr:hypothetical protein [Thermoleophilia bacterium]
MTARHYTHVGRARARECERPRDRRIGLSFLVVLLAMLVHATAAQAAPANDDWVNAQLVGASSATAGTTIGATTEAGEGGAAGSIPAIASVWYQWVAPATAEYEADMFGSGQDEMLAVYTGTSLATLTFAPGARSRDDDIYTTLDPQVVFDAVAGTTYYFQADAVDASNLGAFTFRVNRTFTNDTFASAWDLGTSSGRYLVTDNVSASKQAGEPAHGGNAGGASVWFKWTAPSSATVTFDTSAAITRSNTLLAAYTGAAVGSLTLVAGNDDVGGGTSSRIS